MKTVLFKHVSVIIPTRDGVNDLKICLKALLRQTRQPLEIILVSTSDTGNKIKEKSLIKELRTKAAIKYLDCKPASQATPRNFGIRHLSNKSQIFALLDDDCVAKEDWIQNIIRYHILNPKELVIGGGYNPFFKNYLNTIYKKFSSVRKKIAILRSIFGGNISFKKDLFLKHRLQFDEKFSTCEDFELTQRILKLGYKILATKDLNVIHKFPKSYLSILERFFIYGYGDFFINEKYQLREKFLYTPGNKFRLIQFFFNLPRVYLYWIREYFDDYDTIFFLPGYLLMYSAKLFGLYKGLIHYTFYKMRYPRLNNINPYRF